MLKPSEADLEGAAARYRELTGKDAFVEVAAGTTYKYTVALVCWHLMQLEGVRIDSKLQRTTV